MTYPRSWCSISVFANNILYDPLNLMQSTAVIHQNELRKKPYDAERNPNFRFKLHFRLSKSCSSNEHSRRKKGAAQTVQFDSDRFSVLARFRMPNEKVPFEKFFMKKHFCKIRENRKQINQPKNKTNQST